MFAAVGRGGGDVAGEEAALVQLLDVPGEGAGQGAAAGLYIANPQSRGLLRHRPSRGREVPMERQDSYGRRSRGSFCTYLVRLEPRVGTLYRLDRVLEGRVVQLHYVGLALPPAFQAAG